MSEPTIIAGVIQFYIGVQCLDEMKNWSPSRIRGFFQGIAMIILAAGPECVRVTVAKANR